jgi:glutaredoxin
VILKFKDLDQFINIQNLNSYDSVSIDQVKYTTVDNKSNFCDYCVKVNNTDTLGSIEQIIYDGERVLFLIKQINKLHTPFYDSDFQSIKSSTYIASLSNLKLLVSAYNCIKVFFCKVGDYYFISEFNIEHIFH